MVRFKMNQIKVDQFAVLSKETNGEMEIGVSIGIGVDKVNRFVNMQLEIKYNEENELKVLLQTSCLFEIHPDDWETFKTGDKLTLNKGILSHLAMHAFGTTRGIFYCKTENTPYQTMILPPTNVDALITEELVI